MKFFFFKSSDELATMTTSAEHSINGEPSTDPTVVVVSSMEPAPAPGTSSLGRGPVEIGHEVTVAEQPAAEQKRNDVIV
jgi:hypothetical protein